MSASKSKVKDTRKYDAETKEATYLIALDSTYPTGGEEVDFSADFPNGIDTCVIESNSTGYVITPSIATRATKYAVGKVDFQAFYGNFDAADGPLIEVPNGTNLAAVAFYVIVRGPTFARAS